MDKPNLFIAVPCYRDMPCETVEALLRVNELPFQHTIRFHKGNSLVLSARNALAADFLAGTWTHLLFIDSDIVFTPAQIVQLLSNNEPIIGGLYAQKQLKTRFSLNGFIKHDSSRDLMEVCHLGAGFLSIRREVFEIMIAAFGPEIEYISTDRETGKSQQRWDFFSVGIRLGDDGTPRNLSEDFYFCERARDLGFKVYVDLRVIPGHIGQVTFPICDKWSKARSRETQECERLAGEIRRHNRGGDDKEVQRPLALREDTTPLKRDGGLSERALSTTDLGLKEGTPLAVLDGTIIDTGLTRVIRVDWIQAENTGNLVSQLRLMFPNILAKARAEGVTRLWIEAPFAHPGFQRFAAFETKSLGGRYATTGWLDLMLFILSDDKEVKTNETENTYKTDQASRRQGRRSAACNGNRCKRRCSETRA